MAEERPESSDAKAPGENADGQPEGAADQPETPASPEEAVESAHRAAETIRRETSDEAPGDGGTADALTGDAAPADEEPANQASAAEATPAGTDANGVPLNLPDFASADHGEDGEHSGLNMLDDIDLQVTIELGRTRMYVEDVLRLNEDSVVELDKAAGDPVDIYVNDRHVARGEVLVLNENFCVRISEIIHRTDDEDSGGSASERDGAARASDPAA